MGGGKCFRAPIYNRPGDYPIVPVQTTYPGTAVTHSYPGVAVTTDTVPYGSTVGPYGAVRYWWSCFGYMNLSYILLQSVLTYRALIVWIPDVCCSFKWQTLTVLIPISNNSSIALHGWEPCTARGGSAFLSQQ